MGLFEFIFGGIEKFDIQMEHDRRKWEYAKTNKINILEISYDRYMDIEKILIDKLNILN